MLGSLIKERTLMFVNLASQIFLISKIMIRGTLGYDRESWKVTLQGLVELGKIIAASDLRKHEVADSIRTRHIISSLEAHALM